MWKSAMLRPFCENRGEAKRESIRRLADGTDGDGAGADDEACERDGDDELMVWLSWEAGAWLLELSAHARGLALMGE